jgi:hypothetical protein
MRKWQAIPVAAVAAVLAGAALFTSASPVTTHAAGQPNLSLVCQVNIGCTFGAGTTGIDVNIVLTNQSGAAITVASFGFDVYSSGGGFLTPSAPAPNATFTTGWSCTTDPPVADTLAYTSTGGTASHVACFKDGGSEILDGAAPVIATVHFAVSGNSTASLLPINVAASDAAAADLIVCDAVEAAPVPPTTYQPGAGSCTGATVSVGVGEPTNTPQPTATSTATPAPTRTPCVANCPSPTSLAFVTITPNAGTQTATAPTKVPATAVPGGTSPPPPPPPAGNQGGAGAGGSRPVLLPDTGAGAHTGIDWTAAMLLSLLAVAIGGATGALYFGAAHVSASRRGRGQ